MKAKKDEALKTLGDIIEKLDTSETVALRAQIAYLDAKATSRLNDLRGGKEHKC